MEYDTVGKGLTVNPSSPADARALLKACGAPTRLLKHVELVGEAAEQLLGAFDRLGLRLDSTFVRIAVILHDAGKTQHHSELDAPGNQHEAAGEAMLRGLGVGPRLARVCRTHAQWDGDDVSLEELTVALADKLWKGVRATSLESRVVSRLAESLGKEPWEVFLQVDDQFEAIAALGDERLKRSRE